jgi:glycerol-3-phosphate dehydrogenase (NAD(P)+)
MRPSVAILGAGAWGTALAVHLCSRAAQRPRVRLWARSREQSDAMAASRENKAYLPGVPLPAGLTVEPDLVTAARADLVVVATPVAALLGVARVLVDLDANCPMIWLCKGFVDGVDGPMLPHQLIAPIWPAPVGIVSGPSFAEEVARGLPTAVTVAATQPSLAMQVAALLRGDTLRAYESDDIAGVETGGAVKNVLAIAAGASDGLGFGHNARAALITRGLAEAGRLTAALGGRRETLTGLAGLGDLVLTCTGDASRNRRVGIALAKGMPLQAILAGLGHVAEGVTAARAVATLAATHAIEMPISTAVDRVLHEALPVREAVLSLLRREPRAELS